ncbi:MAG: Fe-S cluster assembly protein SufD [Halobacteria archaeon]
MTLKTEIDRDFVEELSDERDEPEWLKERRMNARESFGNLPDPNIIKTPGKRWTDLEALDVFSAASDTEGESTKEISADVPDDVIVEDFSTAQDEHDELLNEKLMNVAVRWDENKYTAVHAAAMRGGTLVYVPEGVEVDGTVDIKHEIGEKSRFNNTLIIAEEQAKVTVAERISGGDSSFFSGVVEVLADDASEVNYGALQDLDQESTQFTVKRGVAGRDAEVNWIDGCFGTAVTKSVVSTIIEGEGAETTNYGVFFGTDSQHFDVETWTQHNAPNTTCDMFTRGVLDDQAVAAYEGTIKVEEPAFNVDAYQTENVLLVSDEAEADASPQLEIDNHDVRCSHAATMGQVDSEELFYMKSRGLDEEIARRQIVEGFFEPVFGELPFDALEDSFREVIQEKMD